MRSGFPGFPAEGIQFLRALARNNNRDWFQPRKTVFESKVKAPMAGLVDAVNGALMDFAPDYVTDPARAIFRIYRDTRFSKDKTPYKDHIAATFPRRGMAKHSEGGYYFAISATSVDVGGGVYLPQPDSLLAIRRHIAGHHEEFRRILADRTAKRLLGELQGDQLSRVPKGFDPAHPVADLLRFKSFILYTSLPADIATTPKLYAEIVKRLRAMAPFVDFLTRPLVPSKSRPPVPKSGHFTDRHLPVAF